MSFVPESISTVNEPVPAPKQFGQKKKSDAVFGQEMGFFWPSHFHVRISIFTYCQFSMQTCGVPSSPFQGLPKHTHIQGCIRRGEGGEFQRGGGG